jgi:SHS2 domain-containing protein
VTAHAIAGRAPVTGRVIDVRADDLDDLFERTARALAALLGDTTSVAGGVDRTIVLDAPNLDRLLHEWVAELLRRWQDDGEVFPSARIAIQAGGQPALAAIVGGRPVGPAAHARGVELGRPTLHHGPDGWHARIPIHLRG